MGDSDDTILPAQGGQNTYYSSTEGEATLDSNASMTDQASQQQAYANDQDTCLLFRLPPELRNTIYTYVVYNKFALPQFQWDEEHDSPQLNMICAQRHAPSNELLRTCGSIYDESRGIFVNAQKEFWSDTTFTLNLLGNPLPNSNMFGFLERLLDQQARHMTRVNIAIHMFDLQPFKVHLRSGPEVDPSVRAPACTCRSWFPAPLQFIESVDAKDQFQGQLRFRDVREVLWFGNRGVGNPELRLCVEHHTEPVVLSIRDLSRAGLMAVVAWTCDGPQCRFTC